MTSPLISSIRNTIGSAAAFLFLDAVLTRFARASGADPADPPAPTTTTYTCKAIREQWSFGHKANGLVDTDDFKIIVLQTSLTVAPRVGDQITISDLGQTFLIHGGSGGQPAVSADPANATWECRGKSR